MTPSDLTQRLQALGTPKEIATAAAALYQAVGTKVALTRGATNETPLWERAGRETLQAWSAVGARGTIDIEALPRAVRRAIQGLDAADGENDAVWLIHPSLVRRLPRAPTLANWMMTDDEALACFDAWTLGKSGETGHANPAVVRTRNLAQGPARSCATEAAGWLQRLPTRDAAVPLRLWPEPESRHARLAAASLMGAGWADLQRTHGLPYARFMALLPSDGCHALATGIVGGHIKIHVAGTF